MAKHSTLNNPDDLHYAKVRVFSGAPASITPDFADELLIDSDTNKIYRALGTGQGQLVKLSSSDGDGSSTALVGITEGYPFVQPQGVGALAFDRVSRRLFIALRENYLGWVPLDEKPALNLTFRNAVGSGSGSEQILVDYAEDIGNPSFDTNIFDSSFAGIEAITSNLIKSYGTGIFRFEPRLDTDPDCFLELVEQNPFVDSIIDCNFSFYNQDRAAFLVIPDFEAFSPNAVANLELVLYTN